MGRPLALRCDKDAPVLGPKSAKAHYQSRGTLIANSGARQARRPGTMVRPLQSTSASTGTASRSPLGPAAVPDISIAVVTRGPVRAFVGELPVGRAGATVVTLATASDPLPEGGRITAGLNGRRIPVAYGAGESMRVVAWRLGRALERALGASCAVRVEADDAGVAAVHVARMTARIDIAPASAESALDRLAAALGDTPGVTGVGASRGSLVVFTETEDAARRVGARLAQGTFLGWPVEIAAS